MRTGGGNLFNASNRDGSPRGPLPKMSANPTLLEFFEKRFAPANHVLQSATRALKTGMPEDVILACLMHDTVQSLIKVDHGWWGAQMIEPYVSEKVVFAIRHHQTLRFYPDEKFGYEYPEMYLRLFGEDYKPEPYLEQNYKMVRNHKWYELPRLVTVNDLYSFDPKPEGLDRSVRRHHWPQLQAAEGRARLRQQPDGAHVADDDVPGSPAVTGRRKTCASEPQRLRENRNPLSLCASEAFCVPAQSRLRFPVQQRYLSALCVGGVLALRVRRRHPRADDADLQGPRRARRRRRARDHRQPHRLPARRQHAARCDQARRGHRVRHGQGRLQSDARRSNPACSPSRCYRRLGKTYNTAQSFAEIGEHAVVYLHVRVPRPEGHQGDEARPRERLDRRDGNGAVRGTKNEERERKTRTKNEERGTGRARPSTCDVSRIDEAR